MKIYNTLTREKDDFHPLKKKQIGIYACGPTVYDESHIGHARSAYIFDVLRRYLKYKGFKVTFVRNVTDIDDKVIDKTKKELGERWQKLAPEEKKTKLIEVSKRYLDLYHKDMQSLGIDKPDKEPKAIDYIPKMVKFIERLIKNGCAYEADGDVYFDIKKAKNYGKLSNQNIEKMEIGARINPGEKKKDPLDFALWKKTESDEPRWKSPWGKGRPGWHIECSTMSSDILGDEFDIHGGGIDLVFPHHENEIAQSEGAGKKFARLWMHNGLLTINGEKMAKSLGNFITIRDFHAKYKDMDLLKLLFLGSHYRHPVDYTEEKIREVASMKERVTIFLDKVDVGRGTWDVGRRTKGERTKIDGLKEKFITAMDDDFNTPEALAAIFELLNLGNVYLLEKNIGSAIDVKKTLLALLGILGISVEEIEMSLEEEDKKLIKERIDAREKKDFNKADKIREELLKKGIILEDTKTGTKCRRKL